MIPSERHRGTYRVTSDTPRVHDFLFFVRCLADHSDSRVSLFADVLELALHVEYAVVVPVDVSAEALLCLVFAADLRLYSFAVVAQFQSECRPTPGRQVRLSDSTAGSVPSGPSQTLGVGALESFVQ